MSLLEHTGTTENHEQRDIEVDFFAIRHFFSLSHSLSLTHSFGVRKAGKSVSHLRF